MSIARVYIKNFRLFKKLSLNLNNNNLLITGANASGKTSFLEAIYLLILRKSLKTKDLKECIHRDSKGFLLGLEITNNKGALQIKAEKEINKRVSIRANSGGSPITKEDLPIIQFIQAKDLRMIEGETEIRRDFFNRAMFHVEHSVENDYKQYKKALSQRNMALKRKVSKKELNIWNKTLIETGNVLAKKQKDFFLTLFKKTLEDKSTKRESKSEFLYQATLGLQRGWPEGMSFGRALTESIEKDRAIGYSSLGPHRLDLNFYLGNKLAKTLLSRGQQKLLILLNYFKLNDILISVNKSGIIYLIDDITSELDEDNLKITLEEIIKLKAQVLITAINGKSLTYMTPFIDKFRQLNL